jgi:Tol biopolymer transport system component
VAPNGRQAAVQISGGTEEIWLLDLASYSLTPFVSTGGSSQAPVWSQDSRHVYYRGTRSGFRNIYRKAVDGSGTEERVTTKADVLQTPHGVTADGRWLVYHESGASAQGGNDLWKLPLAGSGAGEPETLIVTPASESNARLSPDDRWLAYVSDAGGLPAVWVRPFAGGAPRRLSSEVAFAPVWSRDGKELYYVAADGLRAVRVSGDSFGQPRTLVAGQFVGSQNSNSNYDSLHDGRLMHLQSVQTGTVPTRIEVILNGLSLLQRPAADR